jgi:hypothetical protein
MSKTSTSVSGEIDPVFLRMPSGQHRRLWPGSPFTYYNLRPLVSPGPWNNQSPPIRAYALRKVGTKRGTVLIEYADLIAYLNRLFQPQNPSCPPLPPPRIPNFPTLSVPPPGKQCPVTQLKTTIMHELSLNESPYGDTKIFTTRNYITGSAKWRVLMTTDSVLRFIRSCPPPQYKIAPRNFPTISPPQPTNPSATSNSPSLRKRGRPRKTTPPQQPQTP